MSSSAKILCNVVINGHENINHVYACLKKIGDYLLSIEYKDKEYRSLPLDDLMIVSSTPAKIRIKQTLRDEQVDIVPLDSTEEECTKFSKALQKIISKHESVAQSQIDYKEIDKLPLIEETIGDLPPLPKRPSTVVKTYSKHQNSGRQFTAMSTASPTYAERWKLVKTSSKSQPIAPKPSNGSSSTNLHSKYSSIPPLNKNAVGYKPSTGYQPSIQEFWSRPSVSNNTAQSGGLANYGNYCYMNAILQAFRGLTPFTTDLGNDELLQAKLSTTSFYRSLLAIIDKTLQSDEKVVNPTKVKRAIGKHRDRFAGYAQQDAHEFFTSCLQQLEADLLPHLRLKRKKQGKLGRKYGDRATMLCPSSRNFNMVIRHTIECLNCHDQTVIKELYNNLSIDILPRDELIALKISRKAWSDKETDEFATSVGEHPSIGNLFDMFFEDEDVEKKCEKCGHGRAVIQHRFHRLPRVLALHLKRFKQNFETQTYEKLHTQVPIKKYLDLKPYCASDTKEPIPFDKKQVEANVKRSAKRLEALKHDEQLEEEKKKKRLASTLPPSENEPPAKRQTIMLPIIGEPSRVVSDAKPLSKEELHKKFQFSEKDTVVSSQDDDLLKALEQSKKELSKEDLELEEAIRISLEEEQRLKAARGDEELSGDEREQWGTDMHNRWDEDTASASSEELEAFELQVTDDTAHDAEALEDSDDEDTKRASKSSAGTSGPLAKYRLMCVVHHGGRKVSEGHYVADITDAAGHWRCFNDAIVKEISETQALFSPDKEKTGYMFFYVHESCLLNVK